MKGGATKEFVQAYNAQAVVDSHAQVIVVASLTQEANDKKQLVPMLEQVKVLTGARRNKPRRTQVISVRRA
jgi:lipopolysaccharide export system protein LptA